MKLCRLFTLALSTIAFVSFAVAATPPAKAKYGGNCAYALTQGMQVKTDCSITSVDPHGNSYCFLNEQNKTEFTKNMQINMAKADAEFAKIAAMNQAADAMNQANKQMNDATQQMNQSMQNANQAMNAAKQQMPTH